MMLHGWNGVQSRTGNTVQRAADKGFRAKLKHPVLFVKYLALAGSAAVYADTAFFSCK